MKLYLYFLHHKSSDYQPYGQVLNIGNGIRPSSG